MLCGNREDTTMRSCVFLAICLPAVAACANSRPDNTDEPGVFRVRFETTAGDFVVAVHPEWAPVGAERFRTLVAEGYYDGCRFFRVATGFVVQFGINGDPAVAARWSEKTILDDPVKQSNTPGMVSYAKTSDPNSRTTQIFINFADNSRLDARGFAPFGEVVEGMDVVRGINAEYGEAPDQELIHAQGNAYLDREFPRLDHVKRAVIED
jgi:peptidyl-prolyl cis-trans isomerase A (cyclophilin A)